MNLFIEYNMHHKMKKLLCFISLTLLYLLVDGQVPNLKFTHIGTPDGLSNNNVWCIQKDKNGFIWIGTEDGLNLYDGYRFRIFRSDPQDSTSISSNAIHTICNDGQNLWIGTREGLNYYDFNTGHFLHYFPGNQKWKINYVSKNIGNEHSWRSSINSIHKLGPNSLFIGTDLGAYEFNIATRKFSSLETNNKAIQLLSTPITCSYKDKYGIIWIASNNGGLIRYDPSKGDAKWVIEKLKINSICEEKDDVFWLGTYEGTLHFNTKSNTFQAYHHDDKNNQSIVGNQVDHILKGADGLVWFATSSGLSLYNASIDGFYNYVPIMGDDKSLSSPSVKTIYLDDSGIVWLGTRLGGVSVYDPKASKFEHFKHEFINPNSLSSNIISRIVEDDKHYIWIGTDGGGINRFDRNTNSFTVFKPIEGNSNSLANSKAIALYADHDDGLWIGMWDGGMDHLNLKTYKFTHYKGTHKLGETDQKNLVFESNELYNNRIFYLQGDQDGNLWIAHWGGGLSRYDKFKNKFYKYPTTNRQSFGEMRSHVGVVILADSEDNLWYGTQQTGLYFYNKSLNRFSRYIHDEHNPSSISNSNICCICQDSKKRIWIGTDGGGLNLYDRKTNSFRSFRITDGLPSDVVVGVLEDNQGRLWLSTGNGISCMTISTINGRLAAHYKNYTTEDGLQGSQFVRRANWKSSTGELYFGGINGFNIINPNKIKNNDFIPPVVFTDFQIRYKSVIAGVANSPLTKSITETKEIRLTHEQDIITFEFASLNYTHPDKNQFAFFMKGFDKDWLHVGTQHKATYTNLNPGEYTFYVKGSNNDGVWNNNPISIKIVILPPWWNTWWFRFLIAFIVLGTALLIVALRIRKIELEKIELEHKVDQRTAELRETNNELKSKQKEISQKNEEILQQVEELAAQRDRLGEKNKQITIQHEQIKSSIRYAQTIQKAILPEEHVIKNKFESFIIYSPKDVVSGDFYWFSELDAKKDKLGIGNNMLAVVDCTGHGVPGAFMSMIGSNLLNKIVNEVGIDNPSEILELMDKGVYESLRQETSHNTDGMDMVLCHITEMDDNKIKIVFAGARSHLYYYQRSTGEVVVLKGSSKYIGGKLNAQKNASFSNTEFILERGDMVYLTTDGLVDQNNSARKRFGSHRLIELIKSFANESTDVQDHVLRRELSLWQDGCPQRDDITVIGIRL